MVFFQRLGLQLCIGLLCCSTTFAGSLNDCLRRVKQLSPTIYLHEQEKPLPTQEQQRLLSKLGLPFDSESVMGYYTPSGFRLAFDGRTTGIDQFECYLYTDSLDTIGILIDDRDKEQGYFTPHLLLFKQGVRVLYVGDLDYVYETDFSARTSLAWSMLIDNPTASRNHIWLLDEQLVPYHRFLSFDNQIRASVVLGKKQENGFYMEQVGSLPYLLPQNKQWGPRCDHFQKISQVGFQDFFVLTEFCSSFQIGTYERQIQSSGLWFIY